MSAAPTTGAGGAGGTAEARTGGFPPRGGSRSDIQILQQPSVMSLRGFSQNGSGTSHGTPVQVVRAAPPSLAGTSLPPFSIAFPGGTATNSSGEGETNGDHDENTIR